MRSRVESLRTLADNTDGLAVVDTNDLDKGFQRIVDDMTSYYLLGYYSTNTKLDGKVRKIKVRVKRNGVDVRARRSYRAADRGGDRAGHRADVCGRSGGAGLGRAGRAQLDRIVARRQCRCGPP